MKKILVGFVLLGSLTGVAATLGTNKSKATTVTDKKIEKKKTHCTRTCQYSES